MKRFPKTVYVVGYLDDENNIIDTDLEIHTDKSFIEDEDVDTEVAVYQLVKTGRVARKSRLVFDD